ncbi:MAG: hypothetical protein AAF633_09935 [Chloroflexota bacterium]
MSRLSLSAAAWGAFLLFFAFYWRIYDLFGTIPAYEDALEVIWGILWYNDVLLAGANPFYYRLIFHPEGWQTGLLAHTPLLFLIAQPFYLIGGAIFAYNILSILPFVIGYAAALRFFRPYELTRVVQIAVSLAFVFVSARSVKVLSGHLHILWATSLLPFLALAIDRWRSEPEEKIWNQHLLWVGVAWGGMISFSLYSLFLALPAFFLLDRQLLQWRKPIQLLMVVGIALTVGANAWVPYALASRHEPTQTPVVQDLALWGANLNALFKPSPLHAIPQLRDAARSAPNFSLSEPNIHNYGLLTILPLLLGIFYGWREKQYGVLLFAAAAFLLSLGPFVKVDDQLIQFEPVAPLNHFIWEIGHQLKPNVFPGESVPARFETALPSLGYLMLALAPEWEGARVATRHSVIAFLPILILVAIGFDRMPYWLKVTLLAAWLVESGGIQITGHPLDLTEIHPAHARLMAFPRHADQGMLDISGGVMHGGETLLLSYQTDLPSASSIGSFLPAHNELLAIGIGDVIEREHAYLQQLFLAYDIRYLVIHKARGINDGRPILQHLQRRPDAFKIRDCARPAEGYLSPWSYPICVVEVLPHARFDNFFPQNGFSEIEPWGIWLAAESAEVDFIATAKRSYRLTLEAAPHCIEGRDQQLNITSGGLLLLEHAWEGCDPTLAEVIIPPEALKVGWNRLRFEVAFALSPAELGGTGDQRRLAVAISHLSIEPVE